MRAFDVKQWEKNGKAMETVENRETGQIDSGNTEEGVK